MKNQALKDCILALEKLFPPPKLKKRQQKVTNRYSVPVSVDEPQRIRDIKEGILSIYEWKEINTSWN